MLRKNLKLPAVKFIGRRSLKLYCTAGIALLAGFLAVGYLNDTAGAFAHDNLGLLNTADSNQSSGESIQFQSQQLKPDNSGENYFVNYRLRREEYRQETKAMLAELLNSTVESSRVQAQEKWLKLSSKIQKEEEIENLLKIKGFQDSVADVLSDNVNVFVYAVKLLPYEIRIIQNIVSEVAKVSADKITITAKIN